MIQKKPTRWEIKRFSSIGLFEGKLKSTNRWSQSFTNQQINEFIAEQGDIREKNPSANRNQLILSSKQSTESESNPNSSPSSHHIVICYTSSDPNSVSSILRSTNSESKVNDIYEGVKCYKQAYLLQEENRLLTDRVSKLKLAKTYITDFITILTIYVLFSRYDFTKRNDFEGVIFEENEVFANAEDGDDVLREYRIQEILLVFVNLKCCQYLIQGNIHYLYLFISIFV